MDNRKVVIIGDGAVGSTTAYTLLLQDYVNEIVIIDVNKRKAEGDILDMKHGMPFVSPKILKAGDYSDCKDAHVVIITAGVAQKEGETAQSNDANSSSEASSKSDDDVIDAEYVKE